MAKKKNYLRVQEDMSSPGLLPQNPMIIECEDYGTGYTKRVPYGPDAMRAQVAQADTTMMKNLSDRKF